MHNDAVIGLYGKLPGHGDFIQRNLSGEFVQIWDEWLQHFIAGSQEQLGEAWLDIYLTSPIWRFVFSPGVIDQHAWAGIMLPSVDKVGRYFPFSILARLPAVNNAFVFLETNREWFENMESLSFRALDAELLADDLMDELTSLEMDTDVLYARNYQGESRLQQVINLAEENTHRQQATYSMLETFIARQYGSYSVWESEGSALVEPCLFITQNLPPTRGIPALLDGQWENWDWEMPFKMMQK